jgi:hypothetical protein
MVCADPEWFSDGRAASQPLDSTGIGGHPGLELSSVKLNTD